MVQHLGCFGIRCPVVHLLALPPADDQSGTLEQPQMMAHRRTAHLHQRRQPHDAFLTVAQHPEDPQPAAVSQLPHGIRHRLDLPGGREFLPQLITAAAAGFVSGLFRLHGSTLLFVRLCFLHCKIPARPLSTTCGKCGAGALPPAGEAVLWRPPPAGRACGSFSSPTPPAVGRFPGDPRWLEEHAKVFLPPHSPNCRAEDSSESVPPGTPKLFAFHSSLFSFSARSQARAKN